MRAGVAVAGVVLIASVSGCGPSAPPAVPPPQMTGALVSFDGTYRGTIQLTASAAKGSNASWCNTPPELNLVVQNGAFAYTLAHPNVPQSQGFSTSPTFIVNVEPDGSFDSTSPNGQAQMTGRITGQQLAGQISGAACGYAFTAQRS